MEFDMIPLNIHKANLELHLQIGQLIGDQGRSALDLASKSGEEALAEARSEIESIRQVDSWQGLATVPAEAFLRVIQQRTAAVQEANQAAIRNQAALTQGVQQALEGWQKSVGEALGSMSSVTAAAEQQLPDIFRFWSSAWENVGVKVPSSSETKVT